VYLKRLEIRGFKSFVDNVEINFEPGIDIIVGPNGCGKSNLVDAIRWVLGESNIRHLRGQKNEDVIFNGTDKKKALGMAYVEMTVDNSDHNLPVDYSEVTVGRKVFRSGESEFYINKSRVRMKDITGLFSGTGLGKNGYSIISQGELEQVLNGQPLDRRLILEEASGIIKYRQQRDEVKRRISSSSNDLLRLNDILAELEQRKSEVYNKAEKARMYIQKSEELQELEKNVMRFELARTLRELEQKTNELKAKKNELEDLNNELKLKEDILKQKEDALKNVSNHLGELRDKRHDIESRLNSMHSEIRLSEERVKNSRERIKLAGDDENKYSTMLGNLEKDIEKTVGDYHEEEEKYLIRLEEYKKLDLEIKEMESSNQMQLKHFEDKKSQVFEKTKEESQVKNEILEKEEGVKKAKEKKERSKIHIEDLENKITSQKENLAELEKEKKDNEQDIKKVKVVLEELIEEKNKNVNILKDIDDRYNQLNQEAARINNRLLSIRDMQNNLVGYSQGVKSILNSSKREELHGIIGIMGEIINVPRGMEMAVDVAAGKGLENILVQTFEHARKAIHYLKKHNLGRVTFLPLNSLKVKKVPESLLKEISQRDGVLGLGSRLVEFNPRFEKAVEYLLGRVLIVEDIEKAIQAFKHINYPFRIVSLEGELINVSGAMTGGIKKTSTTSPLQRRGEEKRLVILQEENKTARDTNRCEAEEIGLKIKEQESRITTLKNKLMESKFLYEMQVKQAVTLTTEIENNNKERNILLTRLAQIDQEIKSMEIDILDLNNRQYSMEQENDTIYRELEDIKEAIDINRRDYEVRKERLISYKDQLDMKKRELENMKKNITQFKQVQMSYKQARQEAQELTERLQTNLNTELQKIKQISSIIGDKKIALKKIIDETTEVQYQEKDYRSCINNLHNEITPIRQQISQLETSIKNIEIAVARIETEQEGLKNKWWEKYNNMDLDYKRQISSAAEIREYKKRIEVLHNQVQEIGPVDIGSIQEYKDLEERFAFIKNQYKDLSEARDSLESLLRKTEKIMIQNFTKFLLLASKSFNKTFIEIFGGGEAYLTLETGDNHLETGVDIEVKMPGKKKQSLNLLSGGERALTCIAFAFSLLRLKPAPFCLLDEIDASLDETNLLRFSNFIKKIAMDMQFIVITHRQGTIESGKNIYGVTMPEEGVSSVFAINIQEAESLAG